MECQVWVELSKGELGRRHDLKIMNFMYLKLNYRFKFKHKKEQHIWMMIYKYLGLMMLFEDVILKAKAMETRVDKLELCFAEDISRE